MEENTKTLLLAANNALRFLSCLEPRFCGSREDGSRCKACETWYALRAAVTAVEADSNLYLSSRVEDSTWQCTFTRQRF